MLSSESKQDSLFRRFVRALGPGFITGAADDDPSGIATYSQTGALFGLTQLWLALFSYPFMTAIQEMCGRIGMVTGTGLSGMIKKYYSRKVLVGAVFLLLVANMINIGADLGAMASSLQLLIPVPFAVLLIAITAFTLLVEVTVPYPTYAKFLKYLTLSLLAYIAAALTIHQDWGMILHATLVPHIVLSRDYLLNIAALLGTTISPYLFFWQADEEVEEEVERHQIRGMGKGVPKIKSSDIHQMRVDTATGMFFSNLITFFIIITVATTIGAAGIHTVETAADAASALQPLAGDFAFLLFTLGILGTGLLAVPVLAGSAAYAMAEAMQWEEGLSKRFRQAHGFYGVITIATLVGLLVNFTSVGSMTMLYYAAMLNGVLAPPLMVLILLIGNNKKILGDRTNGKVSNTFGIVITVIMSVVSLALLYAIL
ncbi:MAG: divalent metal cation transporter [Patescibacteria group bacterium]|nr:divalent metal cation transporter [Patescibacteria group bacterium]